MEIKDHKIAWFTEGGWSGKVPRNHPNMRNDMAWMHILNTTHYPIWTLPEIKEKYDIYVQFLQTYEGVEGDSASIAIAISIISALKGSTLQES